MANVAAKSHVQTRFFELSFAIRRLKFDSLSFSQLFVTALLMLNRRSNAVVVVVVLPKVINHQQEKVANVSENCLISIFQVRRFSSIYEPSVSLVSLMMLLMLMLLVTIRFRRRQRFFLAVRRWCCRCCCCCSRSEVVVIDEQPSLRFGYNFIRFGKNHRRLLLYSLTTKRRLEFDRALIFLFREVCFEFERSLTLERDFPFLSFFHSDFIHPRRRWWWWCIRR